VAGVLNNDYIVWLHFMFCWPCILV